MSTGFVKGNKEVFSLIPEENKVIQTRPEHMSTTGPEAFLSNIAEQKKPVGPVKSLYERLEEAKKKDEEEYEDDNPYGIQVLDGAEIQWLNDISMALNQREKAIRDHDKEAIKQFKTEMVVSAVDELPIVPALPPDEETAKDPKPFLGIKVVPKKGGKGAAKRQRDDEDDAGKRKKPKKDADRLIGAKDNPLVALLNYESDDE